VYLIHNICYYNACLQLTYFTVMFLISLCYVFLPFVHFTTEKAFWLYSIAHLVNMWSTPDTCVVFISYIYALSYFSAVINIILYTRLRFLVLLFKKCRPKNKASDLYVLFQNLPKITLNVDHSALTQLTWRLILLCLNQTLRNTSHQLS
jgi:hypothetical protein